MRYSNLFIKILISQILLLIFTEVNSQTGGNGTYEFLNLANSARINALGGINISVNDSDLNFVYANPALLNKSVNEKLVLNYVPYFSDINFGYAAYAKNFDKIGILSAGIHYINYGKFTAADASGIISGEFTAAEYALNIMWAKKITERITFGATFVPIYSHLEKYNSFGIAFNLGMNYLTDNNFSASVVIKNIGTQIKPYTEGNYEKLPFDIQAGITKKLEHAPFSVSVTLHSLTKFNLDYEIPSSPNVVIFESIDTTKLDIVKILDNSFRHTIIGVEFLPVKSFYATISYNHKRHQELKLYQSGAIAGFSWGFGLKLPKWGFSFARSAYHAAGGTSVFSTYFNFIEIKKTKYKKISNQK